MHCADFFKKWKREPNFCGFSKKATERTDDYMQLINELVGYGLEEEMCYKIVPMSVMDGYFKYLTREAPIRKNAVDFLISKISANQKVSSGNIRAILKITELSDDERTEYLTAEGLSKWNKKYKSKWEKTASNCYKEQTNQERQGTVKGFKDFKKYLESKDYGIMERINLLNEKILSSGQLLILTNLISEGYAEDEYGALCIVLKWAAERIESEKAHKDDIK